MADDLDVNLLKIRYATVKLALKKWENDYKKEHGEKPSKEALQLAPPDIKDAYKTYYRLTKHLSRIKNGQVSSKESNYIDSSENSNYSFSECRTSNNLNSNLNVESGNQNLMQGDTNTLSSCSSSLNSDTSNSDRTLSQFSRSFSINDNSIENNSNSCYLMKNNSQCIEINPQSEHSKSLSTVKAAPNVNETLKNKISSQPGVWGKHLNKKSSEPNESSDYELSFYSKMAENMKNHAVIKTRTSLKRMPSTNKIKDKNENKTEGSFITEAINSSQDNCVQNDKSLIDVFSSYRDNEKLQLESKDIFSPNKDIDNLQLSTNLNLPNLCVIKKATTKMDSKSVNHLTNGLVESKILNRKWNKNWVKRCTDVSDQDITFEQENFVGTEAIKKITNIEQENMVRTEAVSEITTFDQENFVATEAIKKIDFPKQSPKIKSKNENNNNNFVLSNDSDFIQSEVLIDSAITIKRTENSLKRKHCQMDIISSTLNDVEENSVVSSDSISKDKSSVEDEDIFSFEDDEWQPKPKQKKLLTRNRVTNNSKRKLNNKDKSQNNSKPRAKKIKPNEDAKININEEHEDDKSLPKYDELEELGSSIGDRPSTKSKRYFSKEERIQYKITNGKLNDNFVKINLKKKVFVRGKRRMTSEKYKRGEWVKKQIEKKAEAGDERSIKKLTCHRCGDFGHWANKCPGKIGDRLMPLNAYNEQESTFLTLEEAADLAQGCKTSDKSENKISRIYKNETSAPADSEDEIFSDWDDDFVESLDQSNTNLIIDKNKSSDISLPIKNLHELNENLIQSVHPLYNLNTDGNIMDASSEVLETLQLFGHKSFRKGQETVIMRILSGQSTLVVQSTGSGKSLCYQLPAYIYSKHFKCITLCVSPLVSLMEDQVTGLPTMLNAVCLHTQQSPGNREKAMNALKAGNVHILLVSPEAIVSSRGGGVLGALLKELPPIAFACLDEAHCLSEWSHNFRPSYLQVCQILKERFHVNTFLGLTATARNETALSIAKHLQIASFSQGVIMGSCIPDNLVLSVSRDANREQALIHILTGDRFQGCSSIIIYCTRREECERVAIFIRTQMVTASKIDVKSNSKRCRGISLDAEAYHAGLSGYRRQQIQKRFMSGKLRIVVATVAFGMGIDKADVQGIIHFNMPRNLESYVQEIGRAGRDGNTAHCHLFLDNAEGKDIQELKRHIFVNSVDRYIVRKLLNKIFAHQNCVKVTKLLEDSNNSPTSDQPLSAQENCDKDIVSDDKEQSHINNTNANNISCPGHEVALPINDLIESLDLPEENIQTLLCYMEMHPKCRLQLSHHAYATCTISCYSGAKQLCAVSKKCPPLAVAIALQRTQGKNFDKVNTITFPVVEIASRMGWNSRIMKQELKNLEWINNGLGFKPSGVKVEFGDLSFHMTCRCDLNDEEKDQVLEDIYERACTQEKDQLKQLQYTYEVLCKASHSNIILCCDQVDEEKSEILKEKIRKYFSLCNEGGLNSIQLEEQLYLRPEIDQRIRQDIRSMLAIHSDQSWTGRAVARVFHGISSPNFPSKVWGRVRKFWRLHLETDFNLLLSIATKEILKCR